MPRWLFALLIFVPAAVVASAARLPPLLVFILAALAVVPLAGLISVATEALAAHSGERVGGLLNATFGNAAELIIGVAALSAGLPNVVRASIAGSIIGNALLVLGSAMLGGGWRHGTQRFDARAAGQYAALLALAVVGLVIPSIIATVGIGAPAAAHPAGLVADRALSAVVAIVLLVSYVAYLAYAVFGVHAGGAREVAASAFEAAGAPAPDAPAQDAPARDTSSGHARRGTVAGAKRARHANRGRTPGTPTWWHGSAWAPLGVLAGATALTAVASEILVSAIEPVSHEVGLGTFFVGLIVLPIVGNVAEHVSAVTAAWHNRMETTMAITAGSSVQVALLVAPVLVLVSPLLGAPLTLDFNGLELVIFALVAGLYALVCLDGEATWLEGAQLIAFYVIVAAGAYFVAG